MMGRRRGEITQEARGLSAGNALRLVGKPAVPLGNRNVWMRHEFAR